MKTLGRASDLTEIRGRMAALTAADAALWGKMSAAEMVCHLRGAFAIGLGEVQATPLKYPIPPAAVKFLALWTPMKWQNGLPTVAELEAGAVAAPAVFEADRAGALDALERFADARENRTVHAVFGAMRPKDWMRWGYLHADHHLRQFGR